MQNRRTLLTTIGTVGTVAIAGCSGTDPDYEEGNTDDSSESSSAESEEDNTDDGEPEQQENTGETNFEIVEIIGDGEVVSVGEPIEFGFIIENTGDRTGAENATFKMMHEALNEPQTQTYEVELEPGEQHTDTTETEWETTGQYTLEVSTESDEATLTFTVEDNSPSEEDIELVDHELVVDEGEFTTDVTVEGTVSNNADTIASYVEVTVRIFDSSGTQLGTYYDNISDLAAGTDWAFEVMILESPDEFDDYDIAVEDVRF